jgi:DnaJ domain
MPCVCSRCLQHSKTLGLSLTAPSKPDLRKAFRAAAKLWHPDRFESNPRARKNAEEHFKLLQIAYRELWEHSESPVELPVETTPAPTVETPFANPKPAAAPLAISFSGAPNCFQAPDFPLYAQRIIADHMGDPENALAIVDLSRATSPAEAFSQYILFTVHGIFVRNAHKIISLLWYTELGDVQITDRRRYGKLRFWHKLAERLYGLQPRYSLLVYRRDKSPFCEFDDQMDDSVKKVVYNFLLRRKSENHR